MAGRTRGPARTPNEVARKRGNPGHRAGLAETPAILLPGQVEPPKPPRPLKTEGKKLWDRAWGHGHTWLSPHTDLELLLVTCEALDERAGLRSIVLADPNDRFARQALRALDKQVTDSLAELGYTPSARAKLGVAEVKQENDLERFQREQREAEAARKQA